MGSFGNCCCDVECVVCDEQSGLSSWSIAGSLLGYSFSGSFGSLNEATCNKCGTQCQRTDAEEVGDGFAAISDWQPWVLEGGCGPCRNCITGNPPPPCLQDINGDPECPPDYPTYIRIFSSARNGFRITWWLYKMVRVTVCVAYVSPTQVRFSVNVDWKATMAETSSYATQRRWKREEFLCVYDILLSSELHNTGSLNIPDPIIPCYDVLSTIPETPGLNSLTCPAYEAPAEPDPCESSSIETVTVTPCVILVNNACVDIDGTFVITILSTRACCDVGLLCSNPVFNDENGSAYYLSDVYDCENLPSSIELDLLFYSGSLTNEITAGCVDDIEAPVVNLNLPTSLTISVS